VRDGVDAAGVAGTGIADTRADTGAQNAASLQVPRLRGALHAAAAPAAVVGGCLLVAFAPTALARLVAAVYGITCVALFAISAAYHRSPLGSRRRTLLARLDHVTILLLIAGTYTPLAALALHGWTAVSVLAIIWTGATAGAAVRLSWRPAWHPAPRWLSTSLFIALGWVAVSVLPQLLRGAGVLVLVLVLAGGVLYSLGAVVYARKRPNPSPRWFGFHEVFHAMTVLAYLAQYAAVSLVVYRAA
jgi:hemolysin III